jgi:hypothetical protein
MFNSTKLLNEYVAIRFIMNYIFSIFICCHKLVLLFWVDFDEPKIYRLMTVAFLLLSSFLILSKKHKQLISTSTRREKKVRK